MFKKIDTQNWARKDYFEHFSKNVPCTFSMTVKLDISKLRSTDQKIYPRLLHSVSTVVNQHEEFRMSFDNTGCLGSFSEMMPCYTVFHKDTETFSNIWTAYSTDYAEFLKNYEHDLNQFGHLKLIMAKPNLPSNTFPVSMIPWVSFDGFNLNLQKGYNYLLPIFTFGKFYTESSRVLIPLSVQVHHAVCDGFHLSRFLNDLQAEINGIE